MLLSVLAAGCGGGGGSAVPVAATATGGPPAGTTATAKVTFTMSWESSGTATVSATQRAPKYVPPTAHSVSVSVNGGTPQYLNAPASTLTIDAPVGTDTFTFQTYDSQNGLGNVLSRANVTKTIVSGAANTVTAVLGGIVASVALSLSNPSPNAGVPATVNVNVAARDADGNTIVGPADYSVPIHLAVNDSTNSGTLALSTNNVQNSGTTVTLTYNGATLNSGLPGGPTATIVASATGIASVSAAFTPRPTFYQFSIPSPSSSRPNWIAAGSDGNMWFTENSGGKVARITPAGVVTEFTIPTANALPQMIIGASDGNLWFTESSLPPATVNKIARLTTTGVFTEFNTPSTPPPNDSPLGLTDRGDGSIWYVANISSRVGFESLNGIFNGELPTPTANAQPFAIAAGGADNDLFYTEFGVDKIGRLSAINQPQTEISLTPNTAPMQIIKGPDGNLWFTEFGTSKIGRLSPNSFSVTGEFPTATVSSEPTGITVGADGALWYTSGNRDKIGRITTDGTVIDFTSPVSGLALRGIATAPDGSLWFCETGTGATSGIGKLVY